MFKNLFGPKEDGGSEENTVEEIWETDSVEEAKEGWIRQRSLGGTVEVNRERVEKIIEQEAQKRRVKYADMKEAAYYLPPGEWGKALLDHLTKKSREQHLQVLGESDNQE